MRDYSEKLGKINRFDASVRKWQPVVTFVIAVGLVLLGISVGFVWMIAIVAVASIPSGLLTGRAFGKRISVGATFVKAFEVRTWASIVLIFAIATILLAWTGVAWATSILALLLIGTELLLGARIFLRDTQADADLVDRS